MLKNDFEKSGDTPEGEQQGFKKKLEQPLCNLPEDYPCSSPLFLGAHFL